MSTDPTVKVESARGLLTRKLLVAFAIGAGAYLVPEVLTILDALRDGKEDVEIGEALLVSLASGTAGAAIRALIAYFPGAIGGPTDALHTLGSGNRPSTIVVDEDPGAIEVDVEP